MTTIYLSGYDLDFRPETYWPDDPTTQVLSTVKGEARRHFIRYCVANENESVLQDPLAESSLPDEEREAAGAVHPWFMGGEYLPDLLPREVEIARISLDSTTWDVISVRARLIRTRIHYRIVDEYETDYDVSPRTSVQTLSLRQMIHLLRVGGYNSFPEQLRDSQVEAGSDPEEVMNFASVSSAFYPGLDVYYEEEAREWLNECLVLASRRNFTPAEKNEYRRRLQRHAWESPWAFADRTVDDLGAVDARMLSNWLKAQTGDPEAWVILDAPALLGEQVCAIEIRWHEPSPTWVRIPPGRQISVVSAFSEFLTAGPKRIARLDAPGPAVSR